MGLSLVMAVLFFVLAAGAVVGLTWGGCEVGLGAVQHMRGRGVLFGLLLAGGLLWAGLVIAWSILPRLDRFEAPGPELSPTQHPSLFAEIARVAARTGQRAPAHVYLVSAPNAFVTQRGGILGLFTRRVMGLGLPLLNVLTVSEFRAVLTHEFGHYAAGDTALGPWLHKARRALVRTVANLEDSAESAAESSSSELAVLTILFSAVKAPFRAYAVLYLRLTQGLSRLQEFAADALAVRLEGPEALIGGLQKSRDAGVLWETYLDDEVKPLFAEGVFPPVGAGFQAFLASPRVEALMTKVRQELADSPPSPYDSHPPLAQRIAHAKTVRPPRASNDERRAIELLSDVRVMEKVLCRDEAEPDTRRVEWGDTGAVLMKRWAEELKEQRDFLTGLTPGAVPRTKAGLLRLARERLDPRVVAAASETRMVQAMMVTLSKALGTLLARHGFATVNEPGNSVRFSKDAVTVAPLTLLQDVVEGTRQTDEWDHVWQDAGLWDTPLADDLGVSGS